MRALVFLLLVAVASAKVFKRCEFARTLKNAGMDGYMGATLGDWVCMAKWESGFDTKKVSHTRHSLLYGIFQISSEHWCKDGKTQSDNHCKTRCAALMTDNIQAAITCAKRMVKGDKGLRNWRGWLDHCEGQDLTEYTAGCGV